MHHTNCPNCGITWEGKEIPLGLFSTGRYTVREAVETAAEYYGWTPENKEKFGFNVIGVETPGYDGVSYWLCQGCNAKIARFTGEIKCSH